MVDKFVYGRRLPGPKETNLGMRPYQNLLRQFHPLHKLELNPLFLLFSRRPRTEGSLTMPCIAVNCNAPKDDTYLRRSQGKSEKGSIYTTDLETQTLLARGQDSLGKMSSKSCLPKTGWLGLVFHTQFSHPFLKSLFLFLLSHYCTNFYLSPLRQQRLPYGCRIT